MHLYILLSDLVNFALCFFENPDHFLIDLSLDSSGFADLFDGWA